jgi:S-adenosylmethionine:tRNA ribosyltransferase-isomerase
VSPRPRPPSRRDAVRLVHVDRAARISHHSFEALPALLAAGDLLVVNDAATFPAALDGSWRGQRFELRLVAPPEGRIARGVLLGDGTSAMRTEDRPAPPVIGRDGRIEVAGLPAVVIDVSSISERLVEIQFNIEPWAIWQAIYAHGRPIQYSYVDGVLPLWSVQTIFAGRPWAVEMPSAARPFTWEIVDGLRRRGVAIARVTHAAGLSSAGDARIDGLLPLTERYDVPDATVHQIQDTRSRGGQVVAVGTSVVRALESAAGGRRSGTTDMIVDRTHRLRWVDAVFTGIHEPGESHFRLLGAFLSPATQETLLGATRNHHYRTHEFGDLCLVAATASLRYAIDTAIHESAVASTAMHATRGKNHRSGGVPVGG